MVQSSSGNIIICGGFKTDFIFDGTTYNGVSNGDIFIASYSADGTPLWAQIGNGTNTNNAKDMAVNSENLSYVVGYFNAEIQLGTQTYTSNGNADFLLLEVTADGLLETYQNNLEDTQDLDRDPANEIQDLSLDGTNLSISDGSTIDLSGINPDTDTDTDDQTIDVLNLSSTTLQISLEDDGQNTYELDLSAIDTDEQTIDQFNLSGNTLYLSLEGDGESSKSVDLSNIDTDKQTIDHLSLSDNILSISLENDGEGAQTLDLSAIDTDTDTQLTEVEVDTYVSNNGYLTSVDNTDSDPTNEIELPSGGSEGQTIVQDENGDLIWTDNTINQTIDEFSLTDDVLSISLTSDEQDALTVDLSTLSKTLLKDADADTKIQVEESDDEDVIRFEVAELEAMVIDNTAQVGIGLTPTNHLSVRMGLGNTASLSASFTTGNFSFDDPGETGQTYTATISGALASIELEMRGISSDKTVSIYKGAGTDGELLGTATTTVDVSSATWITFDFSASNIEQIESQVYSIVLDNQDGWMLSTAGSYDGGEAFTGAERDANFKVNTTGYDTGFQVSENGVTINAYTLPTTDGSAGQVLVTDGAGNLSWTDVGSSFKNEEGTTQRLVQQNEVLTAQLKLQKAKMEQLETLLHGLQQQVNPSTAQKANIDKK